MRIQIESTDLATEIDGVPVRVWKGTTANGVECIVFVHRLIVATSADVSEFETELQEMPHPRRVHLSELLN